MQFDMYIMVWYDEKKQVEGIAMSQLTIKDIARKAGVSTATVSRVINGVGNVNEEMKVRVQEVISQSGFRPNFSARSLKVNKAFTIGLIVSDISDRYYSLMAKSVADGLPSPDYSLIVCNTDNLPEKEKWYFDFLSGKQVDGIILNTSGGLDEDIYEFSHDTPVMLVNRRINKINDPRAQIDFVGSDDWGGAVTMTKLLLEHGHRNIGIINGNLSVSSGCDRYGGFKETMNAAGITVADDYWYCFNGKFDFMTGYNGMEHLLNLTPRPTAVMTMNDSITVGAMRYCQDHQVRIPEDISLMAYGDVDNSELFAVIPTCISLAPQTIGRHAIDSLFERINEPSIHNREIICESALTLGGSVRGISE